QPRHAALTADPGERPWLPKLHEIRETAAIPAFRQVRPSQVRDMMTTVLQAPGILTIALFDSGITHFVYDAIKVLAVAAGAFVGWLAGPSLVRILVRLAFHRDTPRPVQTVSRFGGAILAGFLVYFLVKIGPGWGSGTGDGNGNHNRKGA